MLVAEVLPCPVGFKKGRVVDNGGKQGREGPQQQSGEELGDDWVLKDKAGKSYVLITSLLQVLSVKT